MSSARARYVTLCQQLLALGVVVVGLVPATQVVSLDVVGVRPGSEGATVPSVQQTDEVPTGSGLTPRQERRAERRAGQRERDRLAASAAERHALGVGDVVETRLADR